MCRTTVNCCLECHMTWEEEMAAPYLPANVLQQLRSEHARLENAGFPPDQVQRHSRWEEAVFQRYCPSEICDQVLVDHAEYEAGQLVSRQPGLRDRRLV